ncbi:MAG: hypothetical protein JO270_25155 [Acidobacteriaceae bacterium]|nr:hypothetical protein [Acidobacteriaceae bacterium]
MEEFEVYAAIGEQGFSQLIAAFYKQIPSDDVLGPLYRGRDLAGAEQRLRDFLVYRFGGPQRYIEQRGHPRLRMRHFPFAVSPAARDRWMQLMLNAHTKRHPFPLMSNTCCITFSTQPLLFLSTGPSRTRRLIACSGSSTRSKCH